MRAHEAHRFPITMRRIWGAAILTYAPTCSIKVLGKLRVELKWKEASYRQQASIQALRGQSRMSFEAKDTWV